MIRLIKRILYLIVIIISNENIYSQNVYDSLNVGFLKDTKIVGVGECIHGISTMLPFEWELFLKMKQYGFTDIAFEMPYESTFSIQSYLDGVIDADSVCKGIGFYFYRTKEFISFLDKIREYNLKEKDKNNYVHVYGIDMQTKGLLINQLLTNSDVTGQKEFTETLTEIGKIPDYNYKYYKAKIDSLFHIYSIHLNNFKTQNSSISEKTLLSLQCLSLWFEFAREDGGSLYSSSCVRDSCIAEMVMSIFEITGRGTILIGHNSHIGYGSFDVKTGALGINTVGYYLRNKLGDKYYSIGSDVYEGSFIAARLNKTKNMYCIDTFYIEYGKYYHSTIGHMTLYTTQKKTGC